MSKMTTTRTRKLASVFAVTALSVTLAGCEHPPMDSAQKGYRGTGIVQIDNPRRVADAADLHAVPEPIPSGPPAPAGSPTASDAYQNVQVLGDLSVAQFTRLMLAITQWVAPEQGCGYCHAEGKPLSDDSLYTKVVSRRMIQMTQHVNTNWTDHVADTGVTCYTCHRGLNVPANIWFNDPGPDRARGMLGGDGTQNRAGEASVAYSDLPADPYSAFLEGDAEIRVNASTALPQEGGQWATIQATEWTYGLMMHMSDSLGVNCTFCHNSRQFSSWEQSSPQRVTAWHGIRMVRELNNEYLNPLLPVYPDHRLGPTGDA
ncbi:MAG: photosynthetic reaction center cytochrome c subunit, partial [Gammaproteobacteria bacterium]|nr:photosynthetic reaction center cytochrome c subunit [Gammaproteobacteria bacterium]